MDARIPGHTKFQGIVGQFEKYLEKNLVIYLEYPFWKRSALF